VIHDENLKQTLIGLTTHCRSLYENVSLLLEEVAALRDTVRGLDPTFDEVFAKRKSDISAAEIRRAGLRQYDEIIRQLKEGSVVY
jgi:hypothetical protein